MNKFRNRLAVLGLILGICLLLPNGAQALESGRVDAVADGFFTGAVANDQLSRSLAKAGDVNGDGYDDFLIGAPLFDPLTAPNGGAAYLVLGRAAPWSLSTPISQVPVIRYSGESSTDRAGESVAGAGDVNGDGFADMLIGAPFDDDTGGNSGTAYLILGSAIPTNASLSTAIKFTGEAADDEAGTSVAGAGDVNGDGFADMLIGAPSNDASGLDSGAAYLVLGSSTPTGGVLGALGFKYSGESSSDKAGGSVAGTGDVNGDGFADMLIGAPGFGDLIAPEGSAYLRLGSSGPGSSNLSTAIRYDGNSLNAQAGNYVSGAGDVNGDGLADMLIGPLIANDSGYLILGQNTGLSNGLLSAVGIAFTPPEGISSIGGAGDVNGDGFADFLIGSRSADEGALADNGLVYLVLGSGKPTSADINSALQYTGAAAGDFLGQSVAGVGDVNGDGLADILLGANLADNFAAADAGAAYLILSDTLNDPIQSYRQRQRTSSPGDARPVLFDQSRVRLDFTFAAFSQNDVSVTRYLHHPCSTNLRLTMPIWTVGSNKVGSTSTMDLRFQYTNAQIAGMTEGNLVLWSRPAGQPCAAWIMVPGSVVDIAHNFVSISGLTSLSQYTIADSPPSPTAVEGIEMAVNHQGGSPLVNLALMLLIPASGTTYWYFRSRKEAGL